MKMIINFLCAVLLFGIIPNHNAKANLLDSKKVIIQEEKEMTQTYKVQVSMNQAHIVESGFVWKQGDFGFNIEIEVLDFDTTGATPQIIFRKSTGAVEATEISVAGNKFTYAIRGTELDTPGPCVCDLKLNDSTTKRVSTASFKYFVIPDTMDGLEQEASSYSDTIEQIISEYENDVNEVKDTLNEVSRGNLIDITRVTTGKRLDGSGNIVDDASCFLSDFIPVSEGLTYKKNSSAEDAYHRIVYTIFAKTSGWPANNLLVTMDNETTAPAGACYARFSGLITELEASEFYEKSASDALVRNMVDILSTKTVNLLNEDTSVGGYLNRDGSISANNAYLTSDFIKIKQNEKITISPTLRKFLAFYYNKIPIDSSFIDANTDNYTYTAANDGYIRFTYSANLQGQKVVQANAGASVLSYEPYGYKINDDIFYKSIQDVVQTMERIASDLQKSVDGITDGKLFDPTRVTTGKRLDGSGNIVDDASCFLSDFIPVSEGLTYKKNSSAEDAYHRIVYTIFAKTSGWPANNLLVTTDNETTAPEGACFVRFSGLLSELDTTTFMAETAKDVTARNGVNTVIEKTNNRFDKTLSENGYLGQDGSITENASYKTTGFIKVLAGETITISPRLRKFMAYYFNKVNDTTSFIDAITINYTYTAADDGYIRFTYWTTEEDAVQVNTGSSPTDYESYGYKLKDDIYIPGLSNINAELKGKMVYGFGDSLVYGHYSGVGMLDGLASKEKMSYSKYAINGAAILGGGIETQVTNASATVPDFVIFDGLMNDTANIPAYTTNLGELSSSYDPAELDTTTFYGAFEHLLYTVRTKYMTSNIIFVCCHRTPSRTEIAQETLQKAVRECCEKWSISYVDIYNDGQINCYIDSMRNTYSYNNEGETSGGNGTHLTGEGYDKWYAPLIKTKMLELLQN